MFSVRHSFDSSFQIAIPAGCQNGEPGDSSLNMNRSSSLPSLRWSRALACSRRSRCSFSSSFEKNAVP